MRLFLFLCSALSLLLAAHRFAIAEGTGQFKGGLFFLLIGIQLLIAAALISHHREERTTKPPTSTEKENSREAGRSVENASEKHTLKS